MIRRRVGNEFWLIAQHDHALLSGELAQHVGNKSFDAPTESAIKGIALHDCGWPVHDDQPTLNAKRQPIDVFESTPEIALKVWQAGSDRAAEAGDDYAALLVSLHVLSLSVKATTPATQQPETSRPARSESGSSPAASDTPAPAGSGGGATSETPVASTVPRPPSSATPLPRTKEAPLDAVIPVSAPADEAKPPLAGTFSTSAALLILAVAVLAFLFGRDTGRPGRREPEPEPERGEPPAMARVPVHGARGRRPGAGPSGPKRRGAGRHES